MTGQKAKFPPYERSLAGTLLAAREAVMAPIRPILREAGLTEQQWRVLRVLDHEGAVDPSRLAEAALLHPPSVTRILRELDARRLIDRTADPDDGRRSILRIAPAGSRLVEQVGDSTFAILDGYGRRFGSDRIAALTAELRALTERISGGAPVSGDDS